MFKMVKLAINAFVAVPPTIQDAADASKATTEILGRYDKYAIETFRRAAASLVPLPGDEFEVADVDTDWLAKFVAALLWRASITRREEFAEVRLGPYEEAYRAMLFGGGTGCPRSC